MTRFQYQGVPAIPPPLTLAIATGSITSTKAGTYYFWLQYRNLAGYSAVSESRSIAAIAGNRIDITIPAAARPGAAQNGCYIWEFVILCSQSNDPTTAVIVATYPGYASDRRTLNSLPYTIALNQDEHLELGKTITSPTSLPTNPRNGMRRYVDSLSKFLAYNQAENDWQTTEPPAFGTYVSSTTGLIGCDRSLKEVDSNLVVTPGYNSQGGESAPVGYWIVNDTNIDIPQGLRLGIVLEIDGRDVSSYFTGLIKLTFLGYANTVNGILDTTGPGGIGTMPGLGVQLDYQGVTTNFLLSKPIPPGYALAFQIHAEFSSAQTNNLILFGSTLKFSPMFFSDFAVFNPLGDIFGSLIISKFKRRRLVPNAGLTLTALEGSGNIAITGGSGSYSFSGIGSQIVAGLAANTDNQQIAISPNGTCFVATTIPDTSQLRAIAGTIDGIGPIIAAGTSWSLSSTQRIQVQVTHATNIRTHYPDRALAGNADGILNASTVSIFIQPTDGGAITRFDRPITPGAASDTFVLDGSTGISIGSSLPVVADDFGLYEPSFVVSAIAGSSSFATGNYNIWVGYSYENTVTRIRHDTNGAIYEAAGTIAEIFELLKAIRPSVETTGDLRAIAEANTWPHQFTYVVEKGNPYRFDPTETSADDNEQFIKPDWVASGNPGRYVKDDSTQIFHSSTIPSPDTGEVGDYCFYLNSSDPGDVNNGNLYKKTNASTWTLAGNLRGPQGIQGTSFSLTSTNPVNSTGNNGDTTLNYTSRDLFEKVSGAWVFRQNLKDIDFKGDWNSVTQYEKDDAVLYRQDLWRSLQTNTNTIPVEGANWTLLLPGGRNAYTKTTSSFVQPAVNSTVSVSLDNTTWLSVGIAVFIASAGSYEVNSVATGSATLTNLGYAGSASPGTTIATDSLVTPTGTKGPQGNPGPGGSVTSSTGALILDESSVNPTITATQIAVVNKLGKPEVHFSDRIVPLGILDQTLVNYSIFYG